MSQVTDFIDLVKKTVSSREACQNCPLFGSPVVVLDTNRNDIGPVDVAFLGINPGKREVDLDTPFVGPAGQQLRKRIKNLPKDTTWLMTNFILCHTVNESKIPNPDVVIKNCLPLVRGIIKRFTPRLYVPLGVKAMNTCGISGSITKISGQLYHRNIIPLIHPSALLRPYPKGENNVRVFDNGFQNIIRYITEELKK